MCLWCKCICSVLILPRNWAWVYFQECKMSNEFHFHKDWWVLLGWSTITNPCLRVTFSVMSPSWNSSSNSLTLQHERYVVNKSNTNTKIYKITLDVINVLLLYDFRSDRRYRLPWHRFLSHNVNIKFLPAKNWVILMSR